MTHGRAKGVILHAAGIDPIRSHSFLCVLSKIGRPLMLFSAAAMPHIQSQLPALSDDPPILATPRSTVRNERRTSRLPMQGLSLAECPVLGFRRGIPVETKSHLRYAPSPRMGLFRVSAPECLEVGELLTTTRSGKGFFASLPFSIGDTCRIRSMFLLENVFVTGVW